jgi:phosphopantothenoylcysteine decarboxylase/phosphopantothenate--cysteine ligase
VMAAAVADFRPVDPSEVKIKKSGGVPTIELERTVDILADLGSRKRPGQQLVGFAAETNDLIPNAERKLESKGADFIVANDVSVPGAGFGHDTNIVTIVAPGGVRDSLSLTSKLGVARAVLRTVVAARTPNET